MVGSAHQAVFYVYCVLWRLCNCFNFNIQPAIFDVQMCFVVLQVWERRRMWIVAGVGIEKDVRGSVEGGWERM